MKRLKAARLGIAAAGCALAALSAQAVTITVDKVQQRWPWNNKVDITYTIADDNLATHNAKVVLTTVVNGNTYVAYDGAVNENVAAGTYTVTWEGAPSGVKANNCKMQAAYYSEAVPEGDDYMIVKLSDGEVTYEGLGQPCEKFGSLTGQEISNSRYQQRKYKTTHLVLRKIPAGTYQTGDTLFANGADRNSPKEWTTDRAFYVAIYPWTEFQYWEVLLQQGAGHNAIIPKIYMPWVNDVRGNEDPTVRPTPRNTVHWPVLEHLNYKTQNKSGISGFDLPTVLMHEIATRAGTTTRYFWGTDTWDDTHKKYVVCAGSGKNGATAFTDVGTKLPNAWGLYDMVGLIWEWTLDSYESGRDNAGNVDVFTPYYNPEVADKCVRACKWDGNVAHIHASACHSAIGKGQSRNDCGFRVVYIVPAE